MAIILIIICTLIIVYVNEQIIYKILKTKVEIKEMTEKIRQEKKR